MLQESPTVPHVWLLASNAVTAILTVATTLTALWFRRKREPAEVAKINAETRQISIDTDLSLIQTAAQAVAKAERVQARSDFWKWKAEDLQKQLDLLTIEVNSNDHQMRKQMSFIKAIGREQEYLQMDHPDK